MGWQFLDPGKKLLATWRVEGGFCKTIREKLQLQISASERLADFRRQPSRDPVVSMADAKTDLKDFFRSERSLFFLFFGSEKGAWSMWADGFPLALQDGVSTASILKVPCHQQGWPFQGNQCVALSDLIRLCASGMKTQ